MGQLISNGRVLVINPNGIVFGANSIIDTQGIIASTLSLSNDDFRNGNYHFTAGNSAGNIRNEGIIRTGKDGNIILIAPNIENSGIISTEGGKVILAAGQELTITSLDSPDIQYQVKAPDNEVLNLGKVLTEGGAISLFGGTITHSGELNANSVQIDAQGNIQLVATQDITLTEESMTTANSSTGDAGTIKIESQQGTTSLSGTVQAQAQNESKGGSIQLLGEQVGLFEQANINASGTQGGGDILIGGDYQGNNPEIKNAQATFIAETADIKANATTVGEGGKIIVWADETANIHGKISATGGIQSGNGGFVETSAKENLNITQTPDVTAKNGEAGEWLIDPNNINIVAGSGNTKINAANPFASTNDGAQLGVTLIEAALTGGASVTISTGTGGSNKEAGDIDLQTNLELDNTTGTNTLTLSAHNDVKLDNIFFNRNIVDTVPGGQTLNLNLIADSDGDGNGVINIGSKINTGGGLIDASSNGSGKVLFTSSSAIDAPLNAKEINIPGNQITLNDTVTVDTLNFQGIGSILGAGTVNVSKIFNWSGTGGIVGTGVINTLNGSVSTLSANAASLSSFYIWNNSGTVNWNGDGGSNDSIQIYNTAQFNNLAGGVFNDNTTATASAQLGINFQGGINNAGTWNKLGSSPLVNVLSPFNNAGSVTVNSGLFDLRADGTDTGNYITSGTGTIAFGGGTRSLTGVTLSGINPIKFTGATVTAGAGSSYAVSAPLEISGGSLDVNTGATIALADLILSGGTIKGIDSIDLSNSFTWIDGAITGEGILSTLSGSTSNINGSSVFLSGSRVWNNHGTVNWNGSGGSSDSFHMQGTTQFNNLAGGMFSDNTNATVSAQLQPFSSPSISNAGTWVKTGTSPETNIGPLFSNSGTVTVNSGTLQISGNGTDTGIYSTGVSGSTGSIEFNAGIRTIEGGSLTGINAIKFTGATVNLTSGSSITSTKPLELIGGQLNFSTGSTISLENLNVSNGDLVGSDNIEVSNNFTWVGGLTGGEGILNTLSGSTSNINGSSVFLSGSRVWNNHGTVNWNGSGGSSDSFHMQGTTQFNNLAGGVFNDNTNATVSAQLQPFSSPSISNAGTWVKTGTSPETNIAPLFSNSGTVTVNSGILQISGNGTDTGTYTTSGTGSIAFSSGTRDLTGSILSGINAIKFTGATVNLNAGSSYTVSAPLEISSGSLDLSTGTTLNLADLIISGGTLTGSDIVDVSNSFDWSGGTIGGSGTLNTLNGSSTNLNGDTAILAESRVWNNSGIVNWNGDGGSFDSFQLGNTAQFNNLSGGVFNDKTFAISTADLRPSSTASISNAGTWTKTGTSPLTRTTNLINSNFDNSGTITVSSGVFNIRTSGTDTGTYSTGTTGSTGIIEFSSGTRNLNGGNLTGINAIKFTGATFNLNNGSVISSATPLELVSGTLNVSTGSDVLLDNLNMTGGGTFTGTDNINISSGFIWSGSGGTLRGSGVLTTLAGSTSTLNGTPLFLRDSRIWNNSGTVNWNTSLGSTASIALDDTTQLNNLSGGVFNDNTATLNASRLGFKATASINNAGTWNKIGSGVQTLTSSTPFNNSGTVNINSGEFYINSASHNQAGSFSVASGSQLQFGHVDTILGNPGNFIGAGTVKYLPSAVFDGTQIASINNPSTFTLDDGPLQIVSFTQPSNGTLTDNSDGTLTYVPILDFSGDDPFSIVVQDSFGNISSSTSQLTLNVITPSFIWASTGSGLWSDPANWGGTVPVPGSDVIIPTLLSGSDTITFDSGTLFLNSLTTNANVSVTGGSLSIGDALSDSSNFALGTSLTLAGGSFGGGGTLKVLGDFAWTAGTLEGNGILDLSNGGISWSGNLVQNGMTVNMISDPVINTPANFTYTLNAGAMTIPGAVTINDTSTLNLAGGTYTAAGGLNIAGGLDWSGGQINTGANPVINLVTGVMTLTGDGTLIASNFTNQGILTKNTGTGTNTLNTPLSNSGTINIDKGVLSVSSTLSNTGVISLSNGASLTVAGASFDNVAGATIKGAGTLNTPASGLTNNGIIAAGFSPGLMIINGDLNLTATSVIDIEIQGTNAVTPDFDILNVLGNANLDGSLNVTLPTGFDPIGNSFTFLTTTGTVTGTFATENTPAGYTMVTNYLSNAVTLNNFALPSVFWDGDAGDGLWSSAFNWSNDLLPILTDDVTIGLGTGNFVILNTAASINSLTATDPFTLSAGSLTLSNDSSFNDFTLSGGTLAGAGDITVNGLFNWNGGLLSGNGKLITLATSILNNALNLSLGRDWINTNTGVVDWQSGDLTLTNATLSNAGNFGNHHSGANILTLSNAGVVNNTGNFNLTSDISIVGGSFNNSGIVRLNAPSIWSSSGTHSGTFIGEERIEFKDGTNIFDTGSVFNADGLSATVFNGGTATINAGASYNATVTEILGSQFILNSSASSEQLTIGNASNLAGNGDYTVSKALNTSNTATLNDNGKIILSGAGTAQVSSTNFDKPLEVQGDWLFDRSFSGSGVISISNTGKATFNAPSDALIAGLVVDNSGTLIKSGVNTFTFDRAVINRGQMNLIAGTLKADGGLVNANTPGNLKVDSTLDVTVGLLNNDGMLTGTGHILGNVSNTGIIAPAGPDTVGVLSITGDLDMTPNSQIQIEIASSSQFDQLNITGDIKLGSRLTASLINGYNFTADDSISFLNTGGTVFGTFAGQELPQHFISNTTTNTVELLFKPTNFTWSGPSTGTALWSNADNWGGLIPINNSDVLIPDQVGNTLTVLFDNSAGTLNLKTLQANENLRISGGSLSFGNVLSDNSQFAANSALEISAGELGGAGTLTALGDFNWTGGTLIGNGTFDLGNAQSVNLSGNLVQNGMTVNFINDPLINTPANLVYTQNAGTLNIPGAMNIINNSIINLAGGTLTTGGALNNSGVLSWSGGQINTGNNTLTNSATGNIALTGNTTANASHFINQGTFTKTASTGTSTFNTPVTNSGTFNVESGQFTTGTYIQTAGSTTLKNGAQLQATTVDINNGTLNGVGTLIANVTMAAGTQIAPGLSPGILSINGNLTLDPNSTTLIEIAGTTAGTEYDQINVSGTANLNGNLQVNEINGYTASGGESYTVMTCASCSGDFTAENLPSPLYSRSISSNSIGLQVGATPTPEPSIPEVIQKANFIINSEVVNLANLGGETGDFTAVKKFKINLSDEESESEAQDQVIGECR